MPELTSAIARSSAEASRTSTIRSMPPPASRTIRPKSAPIVAVLTYFYAGRRTRSDTFHQTSWIFAISQLLAALAAIFAFIIFWSAIVLMAIFAAGALFYVFTDRR